ncbi:MAG: hypothetical protein Q8L29_03300 [archaeon]|nr:hypothetical protein [archaeon]
MISTSNIEQAKRLIKSEKNPIIIEAQDENFNRKILEYGKFDILLSIEKTKQQDKSKQLDSGLNHILAEIASKNKVAIGINFEEISRLNKKAKAQRLARIKQNIKICRKAKADIKIINYRDKLNAFNLLISLGASSQQAKKAIS